MTCFHSRYDLRGVEWAYLIVDDSVPLIILTDGEDDIFTIYFRNIMLFVKGPRNFTISHVQVGFIYPNTALSKSKQEHLPVISSKSLLTECENTSLPPGGWALRELAGFSYKQESISHKSFISFMYKCMQFYVQMMSKPCTSSPESMPV